MRAIFDFEYNGKTYKIPWFRRIPIGSREWRALKQYCYERDEGKCRYCGELTPYEETHCHHSLEISEGGTNLPTNLKTICLRCHEEKHPFMNPYRAVMGTKC